MNGSFSSQNSSNFCSYFISQFHSLLAHLQNPQSILFFPSLWFMAHIHIIVASLFCLKLAKLQLLLFLLTSIIFSLVPRLQILQILCDFLATTVSLSLSTLKIAPWVFHFAFRLQDTLALFILSFLYAFVFHEDFPHLIDQIIFHNIQILIWTRRFSTLPAHLRGAWDWYIFFLSLGHLPNIEGTSCSYSKCSYSKGGQPAAYEPHVDL